MRALFGILGGLLVSSCGVLGDYSRLPSTEGETTIRFSQDSELSALSLISGGIFLYIQGVSGTPFATTFVLKDEASTQTIALPNGSYKIGALSWSSGDFQGAVRCGFGDGGQEIRLTGGSRTVQLNLSTANCSPSSRPDVFSPVAYLNAGEFSTLEVVTCNTSGFAGVTGGGSSACNTGGRGRIRSLRVELSGYKTDGKIFRELPPLYSSCVNVTGLTPLHTSAFKFPVGNTGKNPVMAARIITFDQTGCGSAANPPTGFYVFPFGLALPADVLVFNGSGAQVSAGAKLYANGTQTQVYLEDVP